jgi:hypothetical protein
MGWIFGAFGPKNRELFARFAISQHPDARVVTRENLSLAVGGIHETALLQTTADVSKGFCVCGIGISDSDKRPRIMDQDAWVKFLASRAGEIANLDGHWVIASWEADRIEFRTDQLGLRNLYLSQDDSSCVFSTRVDWVAQTSGRMELDWAEVSQQCFLVNQISQGSFLRNTTRLAQAGYATSMLSSAEVRSAAGMWEPNGNTTGPSRPVLTDSLRSFTLCGLDTQFTLSLALSGGFDSRVLLAILLTQPRSGWGLHVFGEPQHPDRVVAERISQRLGISARVVESPIPEADVLLQMMSEYAGQSWLCGPASNAARLSFYSPLHAAGIIVIDGGAGELARRRYMNSVVVKGRHAILQGRWRQLVDLLQSPKANIFHVDFRTAVQPAMVDRVCAEFGSMPPAQEIGVENWVDLLTMRSRFPNIIGQEQSRSDALAVNYMPFAQPSFLRAVFRTPIKERKNGKCFRKAIKQSAPILSKYPLVKGTTTYPFFLGTLAASAWTRIGERRGSKFCSNWDESVLFRIKEFIQDEINSVDFRNCEFYNHAYIRSAVAGLFSKANMDHLPVVDWWLCFHLWKQAINTRSLD